MSAGSHNIQQEIRRYMIVFIGLFCLTVVTVLVSYLKVPLGIAIAVALVIAFVKASLVACYFMHLISDRVLIYTVLIFAVIFFAGLLFLPMTQFYNHLTGVKFVS